MNDPYKPPNAKLYHLEYISILHLLFSFEGRIGRRDFWRGFAIICMVGFLLRLAIGFLPVQSPWFFLVLLVLFYPLFAVSAKRYHDQGKAGWLGLIWLAPLVGWMFAIIECGFSKGLPMRNKYGPPRFGPLVKGDG